MAEREGFGTLVTHLDLITYSDSIARGAIFAMVAAPHCTGCTGGLYALRAVIGRDGRKTKGCPSPSGSTLGNRFRPRVLTHTDRHQRRFDQ